MAYRSSNTGTTEQQQPRTAKEVIAANVQSIIEQLEAGHSDALTAYLNAMSRFHNYILEIARQKPDAIRVAGFWKWKALGRSIKKGEKGIRIMAPIIGIRRKTVHETEAEAIAFVVGKAVGLDTVTKSADYSQLYHGNASLLAESLEVIQQTSAVILATLQPSVEEAMTTATELAEVA